MQCFKHFHFLGYKKLMPNRCHHGPCVGTCSELLSSSKKARGYNFSYATPVPLTPCTPSHPDRQRPPERSGLHRRYGPRGSCSSQGSVRRGSTRHPEPKHFEASRKLKRGRGPKGDSPRNLTEFTRPLLFSKGALQRGCKCSTLRSRTWNQARQTMSAASYK